jgi:uncharacterized integral membrane protein
MMMMMMMMMMIIIIINCDDFPLILIFILIYLFTAIQLPPDGSSTVHIYTQTVHRTTQLTTLFGRLSGIRTQFGQTKINDELNA